MAETSKLIKHKLIALSHEKRVLGVVNSPKVKLLSYRDLVECYAGRIARKTNIYIVRDSEKSTLNRMSTYKVVLLIGCIQYHTIRHGPIKTKKMTHIQLE